MTLIGYRNTIHVIKKFQENLLYHKAFITFTNDIVTAVTFSNTFHNDIVTAVTFSLLSIITL